ncbi:Rho GTPase-activating protein 21 [Geranomyces variabilis]|uniref:Rho GTPase-activating protein 21 n=1 Tax=Geranomyces variabilis TaxID=109894 RepID=A0AAD5TBQ3_9FUNG|nr:Rho GTPase-activating protein 21 [Geranomyces variabilis]
MLAASTTDDDRHQPKAQLHHQQQHHHPLSAVGGSLLRSHVPSLSSPPAPATPLAPSQPSQSLPKPTATAVDAGTQTDLPPFPSSVSSGVLSTTPAPAQDAAATPTPLSIYHQHHQHPDDSKTRPPYRKDFNSSTNTNSNKTKRMSAILIASKAPASPGSDRSSGGGGVGGGGGALGMINRDDMSVLSISMPNRYSVSSFKSAKAAEAASGTDQQNLQSGGASSSFIITDGLDPDNVIAIDVLPADGATGDRVVVADIQDVEDTKSLDDFVPAPAYEETAAAAAVVVPIDVAGNEHGDAGSPAAAAVASVADAAPSVAAQDDSGVQQQQDVKVDDALATDLMRKTLYALPKLPPLSAGEYIAHPETAHTIQSLAVGWPVLKSGLLFRKKVAPGSGSSTSLQLRTLDRSGGSGSSSAAARMMGRSLGTLLKGKRRPRALADVDLKPGNEDDDWTLFYVEVRGRYLMFYVLQDTLRPGSASINSKYSSRQQQQQHQQSSTPSTHAAGGRESMLPKPLAKLFSSLGKKSSRSSHLRKPSVDFGNYAGSGIGDLRVSMEAPSRASNDRQRTIVGSMSPEAVRNAPRTLVHYLPLHKAMIDGVAANKLGTMFAPGNASSYSSSNSVAMGSFMVLSTTPIDRPQHHPGSHANVCDQLLLDVLLHEDFALDTVNELTVSTAHSTTVFRDSPTRTTEIAEWIAAVRAVTDLAPAGRGGGYSAASIAPPPSIMSDTATAASVRMTLREALREDASMSSSNSIHSFESFGRVPPPSLRHHVRGGSVGGNTSSDAGGVLHADGGRAPSPAASNESVQSDQNMLAVPGPLAPVSPVQGSGGARSPVPRRSPLSVGESVAMPDDSEEDAEQASPSVEKQQQRDGKTPLASGFTTATSSNSISFAKKFSSRWKSTFEKDGGGAAGGKSSGGAVSGGSGGSGGAGSRPVISGPTNFTKVEITPAMLLAQHAESTASSAAAAGSANAATMTQGGGVSSQRGLAGARSRSELKSAFGAESGDADVADSNQRRGGKKSKTRSGDDESTISAARTGAAAPTLGPAPKKDKEKDKKREGKDRKQRPVVSSPTPVDIGSSGLVLGANGGVGSGRHLQLGPSKGNTSHQGSKLGGSKLGPGPTPSGAAVPLGAPKTRLAAANANAQPSVSTSRLFFPFFNKNLFATKGKEAPVVVLLPSPAAERLQRTATMCSRASTIRRRVGGKTRPESGGTMASDRGTIGSGHGAGRGHHDDTDRVPIVLRKCIALVEEIGMDTEGLYRISGSAVTVERLRRLLALDPSRVHLSTTPASPTAISPALVSPALSATVAAEVAAAGAALGRRSSRLSLTGTVSTSSPRSSVDFTTAGANAVVSPPAQTEGRRISARPARRLSTSSIPPAVVGFSGPSLYDNDIHVVTGVIKGFLRAGLGPAKQPICSFALYEGFVAATQIADWRARMISIQDMVHALPRTHFATLKHVCEHLNRVAAQADRNRMSVRNLSIIFGPTLLRPPPALDTMARVIEDMPFQCTVVETLIEQCEWVFGPIEFEEVAESAPASPDQEGEADDVVYVLPATAMDESVDETENEDGENVEGIAAAAEHDSGGSDEKHDDSSNVGVVDDNGEVTAPATAPAAPRLRSSGLPTSTTTPTPDPATDEMEHSPTRPAAPRRGNTRSERRRGKLMTAHSATAYLAEIANLDAIPPFMQRRSADGDPGGEAGIKTSPAASVAAAADGDTAGHGESGMKEAFPAPVHLKLRHAQALADAAAAVAVAAAAGDGEAAAALDANAAAWDSPPPPPSPTTKPLAMHNHHQHRQQQHQPAAVAAPVTPPRTGASLPTSSSSAARNEALALSSSAASSPSASGYVTAATTTPSPQSLSSASSAIARRRSAAGRKSGAGDEQLLAPNDQGDFDGEEEEDGPPHMGPAAKAPPRLSLNFDVAEKSFLGHLL